MTFFKRYATSISDVLIIVVWLVSAAVIFLPGGTISKMFQNRDAHSFEQQVKREQSRLGQLCYLCEKSATNTVSYTGGRQIAFCDTCEPPQKIKLGSKAPDDPFFFYTTLAILAGIFTLNPIRIVLLSFGIGPSVEPRLSSACVGLAVALISLYVVYK